MKDNKEIDTSRRDLLKGLTTAAVAGAVVAGTTKVATASETVEIPEKDVRRRAIVKRNIFAITTTHFRR